MHDVNSNLVLLIEVKDVIEAAMGKKVSLNLSLELQLYPDL